MMRAVRVLAIGEALHIARYRETGLELEHLGGERLGLVGVGARVVDRDIMALAAQCGDKFRDLGVSEIRYVLLEGEAEHQQPCAAPELAVDLSAMERTSTGLYIQDLKEGEGFTARRTSLVTLRYVGYLPDGKVFDTTGDGEPFQFRLGGNEVIKGWNQGIPGMKRGGIRRLVIRPALAYGSRGTGGVPPNATLVFDVQLLDVR